MSNFLDLHDTEEGFVVFRAFSDHFVVEFNNGNQVTFARWFDINSFIPAVLYYIQWALN